MPPHVASARHIPLALEGIPLSDLLARILLVEDDPDIVELVHYNLTHEGYDVVSVGDGKSGLERLRVERFDLAVLDLMLPGLSGLEVCREVRREKSLETLPIIILTARGEETDRVIGLEQGADDYITKPFSIREMVARVRALVRRTSRAVASPEPERILVVGPLRIDPTTYRVHRKGAPVVMTALEFRLLHFLACRPNRVFTRDQILDAVWGTERFVTPRSVDVYIRRLREKLEDDPMAPVFVKTMRGMGYLFETGR